MAATLSIGDFAKATQLNVKTLRHYHEFGLLVPDEVDSTTGYRRYGVEQIPTAQVIRRFRALDMPLEQIDAVLRAPDAGIRSELIADHLARLERELVETQAAVTSLRDLLEGPRPTTAVTHRTEPATDTAAIIDTIDSSDLSAWFRGALGELRATLDAQGLVPHGPSGAIVSDSFFADERGELVVFVPLASSVRAIGRVRAHRLPTTELAVIVHPGGHGDIDRSYGALAAHVAERAIGVEGPLRERYLVGPEHTTDEQQWRTEIGWPIFRTER